MFCGLTGSHSPAAPLYESGLGRFRMRASVAGPPEFKTSAGSFSTDADASPSSARSPVLVFTKPAQICHGADGVDTCTWAITGSVQLFGSTQPGELVAAGMGAWGVR